MAKKVLGVDLDGDSNSIYTLGDISAGLTGAGLAKLNAGLGDATKPCLNLNPQVPYIGPITSGLVFNDNVKKSLVEQQLIGNKSLIGYLGGSVGPSNTVVNTGAFTNIVGTGWTYTLPANSLVVGKKIRVSFRGRYSTGAGNPGFNLRLQAGSNTVKLAAGTFQGNQTNRGFKGEAYLTFTVIGAGGRVNASINILAESSTNPTYANNPNISDSSYTTLIAQSINLNWLWLNVSASNSITFEDIIFECLN